MFRKYITISEFYFSIHDFYSRKYVLLACMLTDTIWMLGIYIELQIFMNSKDFFFCGHYFQWYYDSFPKCFIQVSYFQLEMSLSSCKRFYYKPFRAVLQLTNCHGLPFLVTRNSGDLYNHRCPSVSPLVCNAFFSETTYSIFAKFYRFTGHVKTSKFVEGIFKIRLRSWDIEF